VVAVPPTAATGWRQEARGPGWMGVRLAQAAERIHQPGEPRPAQPCRSSVLEPADHGLVDAGEKLELSLRDPKPLTSTQDVTADPAEPAPRLLLLASVARGHAASRGA